jgi:4-hydroxy-tetrahydrodipicolinate synthase
VFSGIYAALLSPFSKDGQVNVEAIKALIDYLLDSNIHGLYLCGGTGEGILMTESERKLIAVTAIEYVAGRIPVIVHVGAPSTQEAENLAAHAVSVGADAVASVPPIYYIVGKDGIENYYRRLADAAKSPVFFYNIPGSTNFSLNADLAKILFKEKIIQGIKYTSNDMLNLRSIMDTCGDDLTVFSGPDEMLLPFLVMGVKGGIGATYNCMPKLFTQLYHDWMKGDIKKAQTLQFKIDRIIGVLAKYSVIPATKAAVQFRGIDCGDPRAPLVTLNDVQKEQLKAELRAVGFFD